MICACSLSLLIAAGADAAPGDLDPTFSSDGLQTTNFGPGPSSANAVARQPDGKVITVGAVFKSTTDRIGSGDFAVARYNPDGSLDTSFSGDGRQTTDFGGYDEAKDVVLQPDGKVIAVGAVFKSTTDRIGSGDFAVARYNPDGSLDTSFSGDGKQTTDFGDFGGANGVALQSDGRIVAVGDAYLGGTDDFGDFALARYNPDGTLDTTFSSDGKQTTDFGGLDEATGVVLQPDGRIVAVGAAQLDGSDFALARYNADGTLDASFSSDGKQTTNFGFLVSTRANGVALQPDGKIIAVGLADAGGFDFALARYNPDGSLDTTFSGDGQLTTDFGGSFNSANDVALQPDGKIIAAGVADGGVVGDFDFALARYNPDGSLDVAFSGDGKQTTDLVGSDHANGVALQPDGKIIAAGGASDFALARYNPDGSLDVAFSGDGKQTTEFAGADSAKAVAQQPDGKIVVVGESGGEDAAFALARYDADGSPDTTFSGDGRQITDFEPTDVDLGYATSVAVQTNGKIVVAGFTKAGLGDDDDFASARYNADGSLDTTFSGDGKQITDLGEVSGLALQSDGKIVAAGSDDAGDFALARYNADGSLDAGFSGDGQQTTDFGLSEGDRG